MALTELDDSWRQLALEMIVTTAENGEREGGREGREGGREGDRGVREGRERLESQGGRKVREGESDG